MKYKVYMHNITRDSIKKEDSVLEKEDKHSIIMWSKKYRTEKYWNKYRNIFIYKGDIYSIHRYILYSVRNNENKYQIDTKSNTTKLHKNNKPDATEL